MTIRRRDVLGLLAASASAAGMPSFTHAATSESDPAVADSGLFTQDWFLESFF